MNQVQMSPGEVQASAARLADAGDAVRSSRHADHAGDVAASLPGSLSASAARRASAIWLASGSRWVRSAEAQSDAMAAAARATEVQDTSVATSLDRMVQRLGPVPS
ncbi:hypothetical protein [Cellulomonas endometrii]|uniref:hypothetical protein n=1 Tax=Cellulomonas endometrii TaxID=3036301 RepID=UPI0024AE496A|nr:hypothetical protein [Cellulomonas endometrii]